MSLVSRVVAASQRSVAQAEPRFQPIPSGKRFYFHMRLFEKQSGPNALGKEVEFVEAGKKYVLYVIVRPRSR